MEDDGEPEDGELLNEVRELRGEFREYRREANQQNVNRRVENVQILVALAVVGAVVTLYSSGIVEKEFWQAIIESPYWSVILLVFVGSNVLFLLLKLVTVPLIPSFDHQHISFVHNEIEPFLYFFAILGFVSSLIVRAFVSPLYTELGTDIRTVLAIISLPFPLVIALMYARANRISAIIREYSTTISLVAEIADDLEENDRISANTSALIVRHILIALTPAPLVLVLFRKTNLTLNVFIAELLSVIRDAVERISDRSFILVEKNSNMLENVIEAAADTVTMLSNPILEAIEYLTTSFATGAGIILNLYANAVLSLVYILTPELRSPSGSRTKLDHPDDTTKEEKEQLREKLEEIRSKQLRGDLDQADIRELQELIEDSSDGSMDSNGE